MRIDDELCEVCQQMGVIAETNGNYTFELATLIAELGTRPQDMKVSELLALDAIHTVAYNKAHPN